MLFFLCENIPGTALSSAICLTMVPLKLKKIFILCVLRGADGRHRWLVCVSGKRRVALCAFLVLSPLFSRGSSSERHHFKAHTATYAFPCQQSELALSLISPRILIPTYSFSTTWSSWFCYCTTRSVFAVPNCWWCLRRLNNEISQNNLFTVNAHRYSMIASQIFTEADVPTKCGYTMNKNISKKKKYCKMS